MRIGYRNFIHMLLRSPMPFPPVGCIKTVGYSPVRSRRVLFLWATISVIVGLTYSIILIQSAFISLLIYDESWRKKTSEMWSTVSRSSFDVGGVALDTSSNKDQWTWSIIQILVCMTEATGYLRHRRRIYVTILDRAFFRWHCMLSLSAFQNCVIWT